MSQHDVEELKAQLLDAETDARFWRNVSLILGGLFVALVVVGVISGGVQIVRVRMEEAHAKTALAEAELDAKAARAEIEHRVMVLRAEAAQAAAALKQAQAEAARSEFDDQDPIRAQVEVVAKLEKEAEGPLSDEERAKVKEKLAEAIQRLETLRAAKAKDRDPAPEK